MSMMSVCLHRALLFFLPVFTVFGQSSNAGEEPAIRKVVQQYLEGREHRDAKAVADVFTPDADQLVSSGEWRKGRDAVVRGTLASSESTGGQRTIEIQMIRFLTPTVALADGPYVLTGLAGGTTRQMWSTFVLVRGAGSWRITAIRNMRPAPPVPAK